MSLSMSMCMEVRQALELVGGATNSIFPQVEALLLSGDYMESLEFVASRKNMDRYVSVMDFFFCELNPQWQRPCRRYYAGMGPRLADMISAQRLMEHTNQLLVALEVAKKCLDEERRVSWGWFREEVKEASKVA